MDSMAKKMRLATTQASAPQINSRYSFLAGLPPGRAFLALCPRVFSIYRPANALTAVECSIKVCYCYPYFL
jgi:hypothetical protein